MDESVPPFKNIQRYSKGRDFKQEISSGASSFISREEYGSAIERIAEANGSEGDRIKTAQKIKDIYVEAREKFHIPAYVDVVLGNDQGSDMVYLLTPKMDGTPFDNVDSEWMDELASDEKKRLMTEMDLLFASLLNYYSEERNSVFFMWDLGSLNQYIWGRRDGDTESHIYLMDIGLECNATSAGNQSDYFIDEWINDLKTYERKFKIKFTKAREAIGSNHLRLRGAIKEFKRDIEDDRANEIVTKLEALLSDIIK